MTTQQLLVNSDDFSQWLVRANLSDQTDLADRFNMDAVCRSVTNEAFLKEIFKTDTESTSVSPLVCSIAGDPSSVAWIAQKYPTHVTSNHLNWYFAPSTFSKDSDGKFRAKAKLASAIHCVVLDDIGQKVSFKALNLCQPTWIIETSPSNYQVGFAFDTPQTDLVAVEKFKALLINAQLCDPGATGASARWSRLPVGINGKPKYGAPSPQCLLVWWKPDLKYSVEQLVESLKIAQSSTVQTENSRDLFLKLKSELDRDAATLVNPVITKLKSAGLYKYEKEGGVHEITCPWVNEHTDQVDHGTAYFEPSLKFMSGGFKCHHSHAKKITLKKFLEQIGVTQSDARNLPEIVVRPGEIPRIVESAELVLADTEMYFVRGGVVVSLFRDAFSNDLEVRAASKNSLLRALSYISTWTHWKKGKYEICDPQIKYIDVMLDGQQYVYLSQLKSISRQPFFRLNGSLVKQQGYDEKTGVYCDFDDDLYQFNLNPTIADAKAALSEINALLTEFSFAAESDFSGVIAAIMTGVMRQTFKNAPMFHIKAPQIASGKSYLTDLISSFATPRTPSAYTYPTNDEECHKLLLAILITSPAVVVFDNLITDLTAHNTMCSVLTQEQITGRILGFSKVATVGTQVLFLSSGNNVGPVQDMNRRVITICLDPKIETPATKVYVGNPVKTVKSRREHFVGLILTIELAYLAAQSPQSKCKPVNGYEEWSSFVRQPLLWLGLPDPASRLFEQLAHDPGKDILGRVLTAWLAQFGSVPHMIREVCQCTELGSFNINHELREVLLEVCEDNQQINRRKLGTWIARNEGRIVGSLRFERGDGHTSAQKWLVRSVTEVKSVGSGSFVSGVNNKTSSVIADSDSWVSDEDRMF